MLILFVRLSMIQRILCIGASRVSALPGNIACEFVLTVEEGIRRLSTAGRDAVVISIHSPLNAIAALLRTYPSLRVIVHRPSLTISEVIQYTKAGAFTCLTGAEPNGDEIVAALSAAHHKAPDIEGDSEEWRRGLIGESRSMQKILQIIRL